MLKHFFSYSPLYQEAGISVIRIIVGLFMVYHGWEVFNSEIMKGYTTQDAFKSYSSPLPMVYMGKAAELISGLLLTFGFLTKVGAMILMFTMLYISFFVGHGKVWYEDQHPFLFVLLALVFFFTGPGKWSVDYFIFNKNKKLAEQKIKSH